MKVTLGLCQGRHTLPVEDYIFPMEINPLDLVGLRNQAIRKIEDCLDRYNEIELYVTGLTVALVEVINACRQFGIKLTLFHYDRDTCEYYPQEVL